MTKFKITRINQNLFSVVTNIMLADGTYKADYSMVLDGNVLRSQESRGEIRIGGLMKLNLGPASLSKVQALAVGQCDIL